MITTSSAFIADSCVVINDPYRVVVEGDIVGLLDLLPDYQPTIPEAVVLHFLHKAGFHPDDPRMYVIA